MEQNIQLLSNATNHTFTHFQGETKKEFLFPHYFFTLSKKQRKWKRKNLLSFIFLNWLTVTFIYSFNFPCKQLTSLRMTFYFHGLPCTWGRPWRYVVVFPCVTTTQARVLVVGLTPWLLLDSDWRSFGFAIDRNVTWSPGQNPRYPLRVRTAKSTSLETWSLLFAHWIRSSSPDLLNEDKIILSLLLIPIEKQVGQLKLEIFFKTVYILIFFLSWFIALGRCSHLVVWIFDTDSDNEHFIIVHLFGVFFCLMFYKLLR